MFTRRQERHGVAGQQRQLGVGAGRQWPAGAGASSTTATTDPSRARPTAAAAAACSRRRPHRPGSLVHPVASAPKHRTCTDGARRPRASWYSAGVLTLTSDSNPRIGARPAPGRPATRTRPASARGTARTASARAACRRRRARRPAGRGRCGRRRRAAARGPGPPEGRSSRAASARSSRTTRRTNAGCRSGRSTAQTAATVACRAAAARPVAMPCSGPRPTTGSSTTCTRGGSGGSRCSGARTTSTARRPPGRRSPPSAAAASSRAIRGPPWRGPSGRSGLRRGRSPATSGLLSVTPTVVRDRRSRRTTADGQSVRFRTEADCGSRRAGNARRAAAIGRRMSEGPISEGPDR